MKEKVQKNTSIYYVLNIGAIIMGGIAVINVFNSQKYISGLVSQGFDVQSQLIQVISYYATSIAPFVFYGLCLFSLAKILKQMRYLLNNKMTPHVCNEVVDAQIEDEADSVDSLLDELVG